MNKVTALTRFVKNNKITTCNGKKVLIYLGLYTLFFLLCLIGAFYWGNKYYLFFPSVEARLAVPFFDVFLHLPASTIVQYFGSMDAASYIKAALFFSQHGYFESWVSNAWPPGQALLVAGIFKLSGQNAYPLKMLYLAVSTWALAFVFVYHTLKHIKNPLIKILLSLLPLYFHVFHAWIFDYGLLLSENLTLPLFIITICFFIYWLEKPKGSYLIGAAVGLAMLAYFRGYFEIFGRFLTLLGLIYLSLRFITHGFFALKKQITSLKISHMVIALITFNILLVPWRIYQFIHTGSFSWQQLAPSIWYDFWLPQTPYPDSNIPCLIQPHWCEFLHTHDIGQKTLPYNFYRVLTLATFLEHPFQWYLIKIKFFNIFWFGDSNTSITWNDLFHHPNIFIGGLLTLISGITMTALGILLWLKKQLSEERKVFLVFMLLFIVFNFALFTFFHYEPRYSLYKQLLFAYWPLWFLYGLNVRTSSK